MLKILLLSIVALVAIQSFRDPVSSNTNLIAGDVDEIQKDPIFIEYMKFIKSNDFSSKYNFPVVVGAIEKQKEARKNGKLKEYYQSIKDVNTGVSWYDAVTVPSYKRLNLFAKVYKKYVVDGQMSVEDLKAATRNYLQKSSS